MSCNGCRVLRKGCSESCILRPCLFWIDTPDAQGHATVFVAKFFGRTGLLSLISAVPESQRPALFQSLLCEACGRTVSPVHGAVGLLSSGNWRICQAAVETVLRGGTIRPIPELLSSTAFPLISSDESTDTDVGSCTFDVCNNSSLPASWLSKRKKSGGECPIDLGLRLNKGIVTDIAEAAMKEGKSQRPGTPSRNSEGSLNMIKCFESGGAINGQPPRRLLNLFY